MMERSGLQSLEEQVEMKKDQMRSDPRKRGVTNDLIAAIANQQILKEQKVKAQALARSQGEPPGTIVEQTQNQVLQNKTAELTNNVAGVFQNKDARKKKNMQAMANKQPQNPQNMQAQRPMPQPNPNMQGRGIPTQQRPMMVAQGGLIPKFQEGGRIDALKERIQKALRALGPADPSDPARQQALKDILNVVTRGATAEEATAARNMLINAGMDRPDADVKSGPDFGAANQAKIQGDLKNIEGSEGAAKMASSLGLGAAELYATKRLGGAAFNMLGKSNTSKKIADKTKEVADKTKETVEKTKNPLRKLVTESKHRKKFPEAKVGKSETGRITKAGAADEARQFSGKRTAQSTATALGLTALANRAAGSSDPQAAQDVQTQQIRNDIDTTRKMLNAKIPGTGGPRVVKDMGGAGVLRKGENLTSQGGNTTVAPTGGTARPELETQATPVNTDPSITPKQLAGAPTNAVSGGLSDLNAMVKTGMQTDPDAIKTAAVTKGRLEQGLDKIDPKTGKQVSAEGSPLTLEGLENLQKERRDLLAEQQTEEGGARDARLARMYAARAGAAGKARGDSMLQAQQDARNLAGTKINDYVSRIQKKTAALKTINEQAGKEFELAQNKKLKNMEIYANLAAEDRKAFDAYLDRVAQGNRTQVNADVQMALGKDINALKLEIQRTNQITTLTGLLSSFNKLSSEMEEQKLAELHRTGARDKFTDQQYSDAVAKIQAEVQLAYGPLIKSVTQRMMEFDAGGQGPMQRGSAFTGGAQQGGGSSPKQAPATATQSSFLQKYSSPPTGGSGIMQLPSS
jgi:hypothetical protein